MADDLYFTIGLPWCYARTKYDRHVANMIAKLSYTYARGIVSVIVGGLLTSRF